MTIQKQKELEKECQEWRKVAKEAIDKVNKQMVRLYPLEDKPCTELIRDAVDELLQLRKTVKLMEQGEYRVTVEGNL